jgi:hypothetical protein
MQLPGFKEEWERQKKGVLRGDAGQLTNELQSYLQQIQKNINHGLLWKMRYDQVASA